MVLHHGARAGGGLPEPRARGCGLGPGWSRDDFSSPTSDSLAASRGASGVGLVAPAAADAAGRGGRRRWIASAPRCRSSWKGSPPSTPRACSTATSSRATCWSRPRAAWSCWTSGWSAAWSARSRRPARPSAPRPTWRPSRRPRGRSPRRAIGTASGVMLYEALFGCLPFSGTFADLIRRKQEEEAAPPPGSAAGMPEDLGALCRDLLRRDPAARPGAAEILERLRRRDRGPRKKRAAQPATAPAAPFVGREPHLAVLREAYAAVAPRAGGDGGRPWRLGHGQDGAGAAVRGRGAGGRCERGGPRRPLLPARVRALQGHRPAGRLPEPVPEVAPAAR